MEQAFIIMQIGNPDLDRVCKEAIVPALTDCGLDPKRVDKHNQGGLLKSEIIGFIQASEIIVADLTNERPNCYLEVGFAMGIDKFSNLILTARRDHNQDDPSHPSGGPKIHFDLSGYDVLFWDPTDLVSFHLELVKRIQRRRVILNTRKLVGQSPWDETWLDQQRSAAKAGLQKTGKNGFMEVRFALSDSKPNASQKDLLEAAYQAEIHVTGWPIGVVLMNNPEGRPRPRTDGIVAEIASAGDVSYDYWALRRDGTFYLLQSLTEDRLQVSPNSIAIDVRIPRITEALLYCARLYGRLRIPGTAGVAFGIRHAGLRNRALRVFRGDMLRTPSTAEDEVDQEVHVHLDKIEGDLVGLVKSLARPLLMVFDFFEAPDDYYDRTVNEFVRQAS